MKTKDFGVNGNRDEGDVIVLGDDDTDDDLESASDIFDIDDDPPNDDGYCDDGEGDEDTYSVFSPKPCIIDEQNNELGLNNIKKEDTPPKSVDETINDASIEASKKDGLAVQEFVELADSMIDDGLTKRGMDTFMDEERVRAAKYWKEQIQHYK